jgi:hypothetical protein
VRRRDLLASLVGVTGAALTGAAARPLGDRAALTARQLQPLIADGPGRMVPPVSVEILRSRLAVAHATFRACRYNELAGVLPVVIAAAQTSLDEAGGEQHEPIAALLADAYSPASDLCSRLHDDALAWVTAERARSAAQLSGDPASIAEAARMTSIAMRRHGHHDIATSLLTSTALDLGADSGEPEPELLAAYGSLLCTAAYTTAQHGNRHQALELITEAEAAATRLRGAQAPRSPFSRINVGIYQIGVHTALGDAGAALDHARKIDLRRVPTPERRARFCVDTARAWQRFGNPGNAVQSLQAAGRRALRARRTPPIVRPHARRFAPGRLRPHTSRTPGTRRPLRCRCIAAAVSSRWLGVSPLQARAPFRPVRRRVLLPVDYPDAGLAGRH